jgi:hypothetical protein
MSEYLATWAEGSVRVSAGGLAVSEIRGSLHRPGFPEVQVMSSDQAPLFAGPIPPFLSQTIAHTARPLPDIELDVRWHVRLPVLGEVTWIQQFRDRQESLEGCATCRNQLLIDARYDALLEFLYGGRELRHFTSDTLRVSGPLGCLSCYVAMAHGADAPRLRMVPAVARRLLASIGAESRPDVLPS